MRRGVIELGPWILAGLALWASAGPARAETPTREESISVESADHVRLEGVLLLPDPPPAAERPPKGWPLAVLIHSVNRSRDSLLALADSLAAQGFACLRMDLRGHGTSVRYKGSSALYSFMVRPPKELRLAVDDQQLELDALRNRRDLDLDRVALVGVGQGALIAAEAAARTPSVRALVLVDTLRPTSGFEPDRDLGLFGSRPALIVASAYPQSRAIAEQLAGFGEGERRLLESDAFETVDRLLPEGAPALAEIGQWLAGKLNVAPPPAPGH